MEEQEPFVVSKRDIWGGYLDKATFGLAVLFCLFVFVSKAAMNSLGGLLLVMGLVSAGVNRQPLFKENNYLSFFLIPIGVGSVTALFSVSGGLASVASFLNDMKFFLLPVALAGVIRDEKRFGWLLGAVLLSGVVAVLWGMAEPGQRVFGLFHGRHAVGRTADMLMIPLLSIVVFLGNGYFRRKIGVVGIAVLICAGGLLFWGLIMTAIRGAWLGVILGLGVYALLFNRRCLIAGVVLVVIACSIGPAGKVITEFKSIGDTTSNHSNLARLQLWRAGLDFSKEHLFLGAGRENIDEQFSAFYASQPESYQKKYPWSNTFPGNFHNSYIQLLAECGVLFFSVFSVCGALMFYQLFRSLSWVPPEQAVYVQAAISGGAGFLASQFFHGELVSYGGILLVLVLFGGLMVSRNKEHRVVPAS
ncbi:o-antigen ligase-related [Desulfoluna butyratoxydans]|uniref:O-antigen ligase-related n=1 Tax=Desulfoluna butyratoxydans TaxID=231438 RepID=A0A4V6IKU9_9BACT|nr:o-antigen ligase-related [Desulfoluna butyratoxydans]